MQSRKGLYLYRGAGFAGSRSGALIATAWAALVHQGEEGYLAITDAMLKVLPRSPSPPAPCMPSCSPAPVFAFVL